MEHWWNAKEEAKANTRNIFFFPEPLCASHITYQTG